MKTVNLGDEVIDTVSDFTGIAVASHEYLHGCTRISVQPKIDKDGKHPDSRTFDEPQLKVLTAKKVSVGDRTTGGPSKYKDEAR